jgi:hypothetical protein
MTARGARTAWAGRTGPADGKLTQCADDDEHQPDESEGLRDFRRPSGRGNGDQNRAGHDEPQLGLDRLSHANTIGTRTHGQYRLPPFLQRSIIDGRMAAGNSAQPPEATAMDRGIDYGQRERLTRRARLCFAALVVWCGFWVFWGINAIENHDRIARECREAGPRRGSVAACIHVEELDLVKIAPAYYFVIGVVPGLLAASWGLAQHGRRTAQT